MPALTTGLIKNIKVSETWPWSTFSVRVSNYDSGSVSVRINGFHWMETTKTEYVLDILTLLPGEEVIKNYYAKLDTFEFQFITSSEALGISAWGEDDAGFSKGVFGLLSTDLLPMGLEGTGTEIPRTSISSTLDQIYVLNSSSNTISVINGKNDVWIGSIIVGSGPCGVDVNPITNRVYVTNFGSNTTSVIDGNSNSVMTTITVGSNPVGVGVNPITNKIYVTNWGSHTVSVIDGYTHVVIATINVGPFPQGVIVNSEKNFVYISNQASNKVTVIDGIAHKIITVIDIEN